MSPPLDSRQGFFCICILANRPPPVRGKNGEVEKIFADLPFGRAAELFSAISYDRSLMQESSSANPATADASSVPAPVRRELVEGIAEDQDRLPRDPRRWIPLMVVAIFVGVGTGLIGAAFRLALMWMDVWRERVLEFSHARVPPEIGWVIPTAFCAGGAGLGVYLAERFAPETAGSGIPRVEAVLRNHLLPASIRVLPVKFVGGVLAIGAGLALGREGPTVQMGGTIGRLFGDRFGRFLPEPWTLIAAGAGAGLAVAFNAPLAAAIFVAEELIRRFSVRVFVATVVSCIVATTVSRGIIGNRPDFQVAPLGYAAPATLVGYLFLGAAAGLLGIAFNRCLLWTIQMSGRAAQWPRGSKGALVGAAVGLLAWKAPHLIGGGEIVAERAITLPTTLFVAVSFLLLRFVLTLGSYGCGAPGGIFAPLLALGALLGAVFAGACHLCRIPMDLTPCAIIAMAALFTAVVRSPLTAVVLLLEMTGSWTLILPMMAASVSAYAIPELFGNSPIYDSLRERDETLARQRAGAAAAGVEPKDVPLR